MHSKKTLSVRISPQLHTKVYKDENKNAYIVTKALQQYYRYQEPNQTLFTEQNENAYNTDIVKILQSQIQDLKDDKHLLQQQNQYLTMPWYQRILLPKH